MLGFRVGYFQTRGREKPQIKVRFSESEKFNFRLRLFEVKKPPYSNGSHAGRIVPGVGLSPVRVLRRQKRQFRNRFIVNSG